MDPLHMSVQQALTDGPFSMRQLAATSSLSYDVLRSWRSGRRHATAAGAARLAAGLRQHADRLAALARRIERRALVKD